MKTFGTLLIVFAIATTSASAALVETTMEPGTIQSITDGGWSTDDSLDTWYAFNTDWSDATGQAVNQSGGTWSSMFIVIAAPAEGTNMDLSFFASKGTQNYLAMSGYASLPNITNSGPKNAFGGFDLLDAAGVSGGDQDIDIDSIAGADHGPYTITVPAGVNYIGLFFRAQNGAVVDNVTLTPEPATMSLLGLGGLALLRRKRR